MRALIPLAAIFAQRFADDLLNLRGRVRDVSGERRWLFIKNRRHDLLRCVAGEWRLPGYHFVKHDAETPDIATLINWLSTRLLRRHVTNSSQYRPEIGVSECNRSCPVRRSPWHTEALRRRLGEGGFGKLCNPEVEHFRVPVRAEHDVVRLDVAMNNSRVVSGGKRTRYLNGDINSFTQLHRSAFQALTQRLALD